MHPLLVNPKQQQFFSLLREFLLSSQFVGALVSWCLSNYEKERKRERFNYKMEAIRSAILPRRLTQMYADTKRSYENIVQTNEIHNIDPQSSALYRKLRIQKDRLFAWGLEWRDSGATAQSGDIDGSLGRAGISDLVASIMSSIRELLDEAESMQPRPPREIPGAFPDDKAGDLFRRDAYSTVKNVSRLADVVKDLTTSIDTLCDLSRSQQSLTRKSYTQGESHTSLKDVALGFEKNHSLQTMQQPKWEYQNTSPSWFHHSPVIVSSAHIDPSQLRFPENSATPGSLPPSYESVAAGSEDRVLAYLNTSWSPDDMLHHGQDRPSEKLVLLDYGAVQDTDLIDGNRPSLKRYEALVTAMQNSQEVPGNGCTRPLRLAGWFEDPRRSRYVFVYELPNPTMAASLNTKPHSLLSFLQHGADTDSSNMPSLEDRFRLAFNLASGMLHLHAKGLTHRNMNSNNILFFSDDYLAKSPEQKSWKIGLIRRPFVTSFDQCDEDALTPHQEPHISCIYRHPRTERGQRSSYKSTYDIYSLGLILLEIGLWMPISKLWKTKYARSDFKSRLQTIYVRKLAGKCGSAYMRVVDYCLRAADGDVRNRSPMNQESPKSQQPPKLETDFYWKAVRPLERCCLLDDFEEPGTGSNNLDPTEETVLPKIEAPSRSLVVEHQIPSSSEMKIEVPMASEIVEEAKLEKPPKRKMKIWSHDLPIPCAKYWYTTMLPELERILKRIIDRWESYSIDLFMAGETAESAKPTIYMMCASVEKARKALQYVNKDRRLFDIKVVKGQISRSKASKRKRREKKDAKPSNHFDNSNISVVENAPKLNPKYQLKPACGASIGAYMDSQHLPPVSFGGTVLVDGKPYGMSVHHMLEDEVDLGLDDSIMPERSIAPRDNANIFNDQGVSQSWCPENLPEALYPFEISEDEEEDYQSSADDDDSWLFEGESEDGFNEHDIGADDVDMGDTLGIEIGQGRELVVTQPAIDDVDCDFFPNEEDMDDDHLSSHRFGYIHASSGLKRTTRGTISHEVDWALIKVNEDRLRERNVVTGGARHCESTSPRQSEDQDCESTSSVHESASYPSQVVKTDELGGLRVHALGRTSGLQTGVILPAMAIVKMPGRVSFSHSWQVMGNFGSMCFLRFLILPQLINSISNHPSLF